MTKGILITLIILTNSLFSINDGLDRISIFVNEKLIATTTDLNEKELDMIVNKGDTIKFIVWTDWGGHFNSTIDILNKDGSIILTLNPVKDQKYEKTFLLNNLESEFLNKEMNYVLNYDAETKGGSWNFLTITIAQH